MIRKANRGDIDQLIQIWKECFGDEETYIRAFLDDLFDCCITLVWEHSGKVVAMLFLLPFVLQPEGKSVYYLYAAATSPKFQGQGIMAQLLCAAKQQGRPIFLKPGSKSLFEYYERNDFFVASKCQFVKVKGQQADTGLADSWQALKQARKKYIDIPYVEPEDSIYPHFYREWADQGGIIVCTPGGYAVCLPQEHLIKELFIKGGTLPLSGEYSACVVGEEPCTMAWPRDFAQQLNGAWAGMLLD